MKRLLATFVLSVIFVIVPVSANAQMMQGSLGRDSHTAQEEAEGKTIWEKLQAKEITCQDLSEDNFAVLGEYFMGGQMGAAHEAMNNMIIQMAGEAGEEQTHVVIGKRASACEPNAPLPASMTNSGMMAMMNLMTGAGIMGLAPSPWLGGGGYAMMGNFGLMPFGWGAGWLFMVLWWVLVIAGLVILVRWIVNQKKAGGNAAPALEILEERYAKGEINKEEFEAKKRDLRH